MIKTNIRAINSLHEKHKINAHILLYTVNCEIYFPEPKNKSLNNYYNVYKQKIIHIIFLKENYCQNHTPTKLKQILFYNLYINIFNKLNNVNNATNIKFV